MVEIGYSINIYNMQKENGQKVGKGKLMLLIINILKNTQKDH